MTASVELTNHRFTVRIILWALKELRRLGFYRMKRVMSTIAVGFALLQDLSAQAEKSIAIAGPRYAKAPGGQERILGHDYRDLWGTPIEVEVLNLNTVAGGLKPVMRVGGRETLGLAMKGQDGRDYAFRAVDKSVSGVVPEEFRGTAVENLAQDQVAGGFPAPDLIVSALASAVGVLAVDSRLVVMLLQLFVVSRLIKFIGVRGALFVLPSVALLAYGLVAIAPVLAFVRVAKVFENATDYSIQNTTRQALFLITSREAKYKAKAAIDSFFWRIGDVLAATLVFIGTQFQFGTKTYAIFNVVLAVLWMGLVSLIALEHKKLSTVD